MNQTAYMLWVKALPSLDSQQLQDLSNRLKVLNSVNIAQHTGKSDFGMRVVNTICDVLRKNRVDSPSMQTLCKSSAYASCKDKLNDLATFFESVSQVRLVQDAILKQAIQLLYVDLLNWNVPISAHTILRQIHRVPATLNRYFPGYQEAGLLTKIVKESDR